MEKLNLKKDRVALEQVKKINILAGAGDQKYDYEKFKFKVVAIGNDVSDKSLVGKTIIKQDRLGIPIESEGKEFIIIREDDILATL